MVVRYAHSGTPGCRDDWQTLSEHSHNVGEMAAERATQFGMAALAQLAGRFHDLGKYNPDFDRVLSGELLRVDHSTAGGKMLQDRAQQRLEAVVAQMLGYCILGHHAGLPDGDSGSETCLKRRLERFDARLDPVWETEVPVDFTGTLSELRAKIRQGPNMAFDLAMAIRMLFSCLVDADFRDTEAFYTRLERREVARDWPCLAQLLPELRKTFDANVAGFRADTELNRLRAEILAHVRAGAARAPGLFTLTVPTGGGKTLASMGFALDHAVAHGARRIIYAIPYTSIIDQTAAVFRDLFGEDVVLEHHSAIEEERAGADCWGRDKLRLAMEDWAAPVVVTTNVQLFESLFAARTSRARKLHNIAGSVIVLDEAQCLPRKLLLPSLRALEALAAHYGCTVVLCTATQPAFDSRELGAGGLALEGRELAPDPAALARRLKRARILRGGPMSDAALVEALGSVPQGLVIVNSRAHALELYREAQDAGLEGLVHLTTRQCPANRQRVLADIRERLDVGEGTPCRVIATSLVEAGVDLSFPRVWRAEAGLDSIVQAAGRCNREDRWPLEDSLVTVFEAPDHLAPAAVRVLAQATAKVAAQHDDILSAEAIRAWFQEVYWREGERLDAKDILGKMSFAPDNRALGANIAFREISDDYRMVETTMVPVIVPFDEAAREAVARLDDPGEPSGAIARDLQRFVVQVPPKARALLLRDGIHAEFACPALRGDQFCVLKTESLYHEDSGLWWEDAEYLDAEKTVI